MDKEQKKIVKQIHKCTDTLNARIKEAADTGVDVYLIVGNPSENAVKVIFLEE